MVLCKINITHGNMSTLCRACLVEIDPTAESYSFHEVTQEHTIDPNIFTILTGLEVDRHAEDTIRLPQKLCNNCAESFDLIKSFRIKCISSNQWLTQQNFPEEKTTTDGSYTLQINIEAEPNVSLTANTGESLVTPYYECDLCSMIFHQKHRIEAHLGRHCHPKKQQHTMTINKSHSCEFCELVFTKRGALLSHTRRVHYGYKPYACTFCDQTFAKSTTLRSHTMRHTGEKPHACQLCDRRFIQLVALRRHMKVHIKKADPIKKDDQFDRPQATAIAAPYQCELCKQSFTNMQSIELHLRQHYRTDPNPKPSIKRFVCDQCGKAFMRKSQLNSHTLTHRSSEFACEQCPMQFTTKYRLETHLKRHNEVKRFACSMCDVKTSTARQLERHIEHHNPEFTHSCCLCESKFRNKMALDRHTQVVHYDYKPYSCSYCDKTFSKSETLRHHTMRHTGEKPEACHMCDSRFIQKVALRRHLKTHNIHYEPKQRDFAIDKTNRPKYECAYCEKIFYRKLSMEKHIQLCALDRKPEIVAFICETCGKDFKKQSYLTSHRFTHIDPEHWPFLCEHCPKRFVAKHKFRAHMLSHVGGTMNYACLLCDTRTSTQKALNAHMVYHNPEYSHPCDKCESKFRNPAALFRHNRVVHEGYKPYGCNYCEQSFSKSETLKHHLMRHTGERPHACPVCDYRFIQIVALKRHMKIHSKPVSERKKRKKTETIIS